jgi:thymidylate synthase
MIIAKNMGEAYLSLLKLLLLNGKIQTINRLDTYTQEVLGLQIVVPAKYNFFFHPQREINYRFMIAEWLWIMAGRNDLATLTRYNSKMGSFSDDGLKLAGAYGPKIKSQWEYVVKTLACDRTSRQAVMTIWERNPAPSKDIPCTTSAQFIIRNEQLHGIFTMRSSDAWLGIPYDCFTFGQIINSLASRLDAAPGYLHLIMGSSHLYQENIRKAQAVVDSPDKMKSFESPILATSYPPADSILVSNKLYLPAVWEKYREALMSGTSENCLRILTEGQ